jgi:hypothetical protein
MGDQNNIPNTFTARCTKEGDQGCEIILADGTCCINTEDDEHFHLSKCETQCDVDAMYKHLRMIFFWYPLYACLGLAGFGFFITMTEGISIGSTITVIKSVTLSFVTLKSILIAILTFFALAATITYAVLKKTKHIKKPNIHRPRPRKPHFHMHPHPPHR